MLELRRIQDNPEELEEMLRKRRYGGVDIAPLQEKLARARELKGKIDGLRMERNAASKEIGALIGKGEKDAAEKRKAEVKSLGDALSGLEGEQETLENETAETIQGLPNWVAADVPDGADENDNTVLREEGKKPQFDFKPLPHFELGEKSGILDFEGGVKLAGSRFYSYRGLAARLERALISFMLDLHADEHGYEERWVPSLILDEGMYVTGQYPKFKGEYYSMAEDGLSLIPTAEVPLVNLYREDIIPAEELPVALTAATSCFRREAGSAGKDTRGLVRVHQFQKVELVRIVRPEDSWDAHEQMLAHAEEVLKRLGLAYRVLLLCSGDMGASAAKTYDLEVWMPGLDRWLEISSISNCLDYQARRGMIRYKDKSAGKKAKPILAHTLNGSGVAAGRALAAIMETYQTSDGDFTIPEVLQPYMKRA